jgi:nitrate reductase alpha subunit
MPLLHDTTGELAQPFGGTDWKTDGVAPVPGKNAPNIVVVERDYPNTYKKFTSLGPVCSRSWAMVARASTGTPMTKSSSLVS